MTLVAGSYEKFILGWRLNQKKKKDHEEKEEGFGLKPIFTYPAHMGPIKCLAMAGPVLVTGGMDDTIKIFDLASYSEMGSLLQHTAAITSLCFYGDESSVKSGGSTCPRNLLSGSLDGNICIWDSDLWVHLKTLKAHRKGVNDLSIHPSGRLALSVGRDCQLSMFDLIKGRCTFKSNLQKEATAIDFSSKGGDIYSMVMENVVSVHSAEDARLLHSLHHKKRVLCLAHTENGLLLTGGEEPTIQAWDLGTGKIAFSLENVHKNRIKGLAVLGSKSTTESDDNPYFIASASSDGIVRVWDVRMLNKDNSTPIIETDSKARITCLVGCTSKRVKKSPPVVSEGKVVLDNQETASASTETQSKSKDENFSVGGIADDSKPEKKSRIALKKKKFKNGLGIKGKKAMKFKGHSKSKEKRPGV